MNTYKSFPYTFPNLELEQLVQSRKELVRAVRTFKQEAAKDDFLPAPLENKYTTSANAIIALDEVNIQYDAFSKQPAKLINARSSTGKEHYHIGFVTKGKFEDAFFDMHEKKNSDEISKRSTGGRHKLPLAGFIDSTFGMPIPSKDTTKDDSSMTFYDHINELSPKTDYVKDYFAGKKSIKELPPIREAQPSDYTSLSKKDADDIPFEDIVIKSGIMMALSYGSQVDSSTLIADYEKQFSAVSGAAIMKMPSVMLRAFSQAHDNYQALKADSNPKYKV